MSRVVEPGIWCLLAVVSIATSAVSGVVGMAGGMLLLSAMLLGLDPVTAIPIHGVVQLVSNASRAWFQRKNVCWRVVWRFVLPLLPFGLLGVSLVRAVPSGVLLILVGLFVLGTTFAPAVFAPLTKPRWGQGPNSPGRPENGLLFGGALVGFVSPLIGATGTLLAPFILALELGPQQTIGTLAACQSFQHASKLLLFGATGFAFPKYALPMFALCLGAILGSAIGARLLGRVEVQSFKRWVRLVLAFLACKLIFDGARELFG